MAEPIQLPIARAPGGARIPAQPVVLLNPDGTAASLGGGGGAGGEITGTVSIEGIVEVTGEVTIPGTVQVAGEVTVPGSGLLSSASFTPTATAYAAGDLISVAQALNFVDANGDAVPAGSIIRILSAALKIDVTAIPSGMTSFTLHLYSATPPSAQADNAAWTLASGDLPSYRGSIPLGSPADLGAALYCRAQYLDVDIKLLTSGLFGVLVTDGAHTPAAVARQVVLYGVVL